MEPQCSGKWILDSLSDFFLSGDGESVSKGFGDIVPLPALTMVRDLEYTIPKDELERLYLDEGLSIKECAEYFECSTAPIEDRLRKYDIPVRSRGNQPLELPEDTLRELYVEAGLTTTEIAENDEGKRSSAPAIGANSAG